MPTPWNRGGALRVLALCTLFLTPCACSPQGSQTVFASAEDEHEPEPVAITVFTDKVQLFMEYPRLMPDLEGRYLAHVTVLASGQPVRSGKLRLELTGPDGVLQVFAADKPTRDGLFIPVGALQEPGSYAARIVVQSEQVEDSIELPSVVVHHDLVAALLASEADEMEEPPNAVPLLLESQWKIELLMEQVARRTMIRRLQVHGEIEAPQHAKAAISAPLGGLLLPPEGGRLPRIGELVKKGQVIGLIEAPLSTADRTQIAAVESTRAGFGMELLLREYDLRSKVLELEAARAQAQTRQAFSNKQVQRLEELHKEDLGNLADLEAARRDLGLAVLALEGQEVLLASYAQASVQLQQLGERNAGLASVTPERLELIAPIDAEIEVAMHVEGEQVAPGDPIYRLINFDKAWISVHVSEFDFASLGENPGALMRLAAYPDREFDVLREMGGRVVHVGHLVDLESRTIELSYEIPNSDYTFRSGMFADVFLETKTSIDALSIPRAAVVTDNGRSVAFVLVHGELFQKRVLELGIRDGEFVEVLSGLEPGERVVTKGAYLVKLASASPASFGEGHAH